MRRFRSKVVDLVENTRGKRRLQVPHKGAHDHKYVGLQVGSRLVFGKF